MLPTSMCDHPAVLLPLLLTIATSSYFGHVTEIIVRTCLQSWTPPQLRSKRGESASGRGDSVEPAPRRTRRSAAPTPKKAAAVAMKKEQGPGVSLATRSRGRSYISAQVDTEEDSMATGASMGGSRKSVGPRRNSTAHRLETTLTDKVYSTPSGRQSRSRKHSTLSPAATAD